MGILIESVRVNGFRGLENIEVNLKPVSVLTGMNNSGKTSFLKAVQIALGHRSFLTSDDFHISEDSAVDKIIVDFKIIATKEDGKQDVTFSEEWETVFTESRISFDENSNQIVPIRSIISYDPINGNFKCKQFVLNTWNEFKKGDGTFWYQSDNGTSTSFNLDELTFVYTDAQRDMLDDLKVKNSYLGKMLSKIKYEKSDVDAIELLIEELNSKAVGASDVLSSIQETLKGLDSAMDNSSSGVEISPFAKKIRDLNKGVSIQYSDFSMEYHGMGTRSWASLLTLKAFIGFLERNALAETKQFFPILAIEEPEAHLHPNAQKQIYNQLSSIGGQIIISTHSPYIAASARLEEIISFYKNENIVTSSALDVSGLTQEEIRKINRQVINTRGELFFAKVVVFAEGETEEQALSILASKYFDKNILETGINVIGIDGKGNYGPFVRFANSFNIPWFIFSDSDGDTVREVKALLNKQGITNYDNIIFLDKDHDFEKQMIYDGYQQEIKDAILKSIFPPDAHENYITAKTLEVNGYNDQKVYEILTGSKAEFGLLVADSIVNSGKEIPPLVKTLFDKISITLKLVQP